MYYLVIKITNNVNGKSFISSHKTKKIDDGYMGAGKLIKAAIAEHGVSNFSREILGEYASLEEMKKAKFQLMKEHKTQYNINRPRTSFDTWKFTPKKDIKPLNEKANWKNFGKFEFVSKRK